MIVVDKKTWFTSDLHLGHDREFIWKPRGFNSVYEMNETIIKNWNSVVNPKDDVYVLGDLMLGDNENGRKLLCKLKGNLHIILGNHDSDVRQEIYDNLYNVVEITYVTIVKYNNYKFYLSHYPTITSSYDENKPLKAKVINLCGHTHTEDKFKDWDKGLIYHVELDAHNNELVNINRIINDIKEKIVIEKERK